MSSLRCLVAVVGAPAVLLVLAGAPPPATAETAAEKGWRIAEEADRRDRGWGAASGELTMTLINEHGDTSERQLRMKLLENPSLDDGDKSLAVFDHPRDIRGTALLSYSHIRAPDDQWLFLPALKRVKRINSNNKSGSFMGSEFAYEDFTSSGLRKFEYKWLRDEPCGEATCFVLERYPQYQGSGYTREVVWIESEHYREQRLEFYDRKDALLKTLTVADYRLYRDKYWRAHDLLMENVQTRKSSRLVWTEYELGVDLDDGDFTIESLKRVR